MKEVYVKERTIEEKDGCKVIEERRYAGTLRPDGGIRLNAFVGKRMVERNQCIVSKDEHHKVAA